MERFTYYKSVIIKYLQQHVILSLGKKTARFSYSDIFIQNFINELTSKGYKHTDQSDGLNAVSHKNRAPKRPKWNRDFSQKERYSLDVLVSLVPIAKVPLTT